MKMLEKITQEKKVLNFGLPCSPAKKVEEERHHAKKVLLTFGGGMGGAHRDIFIKDKDIKYNTHGIAKVTNIFTNEVMEINSKYVVSANDIDLLFMKFDTTAHSNYHTRKYKYTETIQVFEIPKNAVVKFISDFHADKSKVTCVETFNKDEKL